MLKIDIRRGKILEKLHEQGSVLVSQLAKELEATPVTIRSDLDKLEADGQLMRVQGGAVLKPQVVDAACHSFDSVKNRDEKNRIAQVVASHIRDGDTLFMNSGTTVLQVGKALRQRRNLNIVTNSLEVAQEMGKIPTVRVILLGGEVNAQYDFTGGCDAQEQLGHYQADWAVLSLDGISAAGGLTTYHAEEAIVNRMMVTQAKRTLVAADHTKVGKVGFSRFCEAGPDICLVTDAMTDYEAASALEERGVVVIFANGEQ
ncbi:MAG: DeoR/GlpR transcriptional regulator [Oscillospiraceae bacterium]|nr:DeoR/GlpR transcriptional regulator [Oscillospiraceae bacterium]